MRFAFVGDHASPFTESLLGDIERALLSSGHSLLRARSAADVPADIDAVVNVTRAESPRPNYVRSSPANFVCTVAEAPVPEPGADLQSASYRVLVQTMSNLLLYAVPGAPEPSSWLVTPELGFRRLAIDEAHSGRVLDKILALADVTFVIDNDLAEDLPEALREGDEITRTLQRVGRKLDGLGLLPSVLPLDEILSERDRRLLMKVFGVKQLSYGNLSARRDAASFWMSGRGVDKANLREIGKDMLLVTGVDEEAGKVRVSVPPGTDPTSRVSVDAVEHALIYREFPGVGAIIHVHAWMPGIDATLQNYPCGTVDLAREVLELVRRAPDPCNAVVGLLNHGITATGPDLDTLFDRIAGRLERQVPMR